ncbi:glycosyltransferase family 2 protein [Paracoccus sp. 1_MG-2023]|uniref:glycosyltransferase family 2 protein n=1 Tax=unclassified Paracoccus (in: a-proteobacteria) TaxID=2688777 RepID=UPI001C0A5433|nr:MULTISPECIES: glycosyltransferase family 2 protein [unclassified Paracoccus (in: a-proteobacteria)]MBU2956869.1 glycosyltransferase family 2 protein [Paracoccus sp. C2R09]MDO6668067.1 glycosyltransferase family 2 protein [Paracoccus sp. 1_MG-2023]
MIGQLFRGLKHRRRIARALAGLEAPAPEARPHGLPGPLVVSLTSHAARFGTLKPTLQSILRQDIRPDAVILWVGQDDLDQLPRNIRDLPGLELRSCRDLRSYTKIVPTLRAHPDAHVVTADDDVHYEQGWLAGLVDAARNGAAVACHRAHRVAMEAPGRPAPYDMWDHNIDAPDAGPQVFLTGVCGVIYAPGALHPDVLRDDLFTTLAPSSDDVWLYWMHRLNGVEAVKIGGRRRILEWEGSQDICLRQTNTQAGTGNDRAIAALMDRYGWPGGAKA